MGISVSKPFISQIQLKSGWKSVTIFYWLIFDVGIVPGRYFWRFFVVLFVISKWSFNQTVPKVYALLEINFARKFCGFHGKSQIHILASLVEVIEIQYQAKNKPESNFLFNKKTFFFARIKLPMFLPRPTKSINQSVHGRYMQYCICYDLHSLCLTRTPELHFIAKV